MLFPPLRFRLQIVNECGSTNEVLLGSRATPDFPGRAILALKQTAGYGRRGREWDSGEGNFALSMGMRLEVNPSLIPLLPFLAGLALYDQAARHLPFGEGLRLKWPNDIYLHGRKLGGMLAQARQGPSSTDVVLGIGVNLRHAPAGMESTATSLAEHGVNTDPESFALGFLPRFERVLDEAVSFDWLKERWEEKARLHEGALYVLGENAPVHPVALLQSGELLVENEDGSSRTLSSEEVSLRFTPPSA